MIVTEHKIPMKINKKDKIFYGMGWLDHDFKKLRENGYKDVITIKKDLDLSDQGITFKFINRQKPKVVIIAAAYLEA